MNAHTNVQVIHQGGQPAFVVIAYEDYIYYKSEAACRSAGKLRLEGKEYEVKDGDVMHFLFNV